MCTFKDSPGLKNKEGNLNMKRLHIRTSYPCMFLSLLNTQTMISGKAFACTIHFISVSLLNTNDKAPATLAFYKNSSKKPYMGGAERESGKRGCIIKKVSWRIPHILPSPAFLFYKYLFMHFPMRVTFEVQHNSCDGSQSPGPDPRITLTIYSLDISVKLHNKLLNSK